MIIIRTSDDHVKINFETEKEKDLVLWNRPDRRYVVGIDNGAAKGSETRVRIWKTNPNNKDLAQQFNYENMVFDGPYKEIAISDERREGTFS